MNNGPKFARWLFAAAVAGLSARVLASRSRLFPPRRCLRLPEVNKSLMSVPDLRTSGKKLEDWTKPDGSALLTFRATASSGSVTMKPLNQFWGRFATYWNVT
jgi:hypothetical protein